MRLKKILVGVTLFAFLGSDFTFGIAPALGQSSSTGDGLMPSLSGDGTFGRVLPGPSTPVPYQIAPQQPQLQPQQFPTPRPIAPATPNLCQPGGGTRSLQTAAVPRTRTLEPFGAPPVPSPQIPVPTVTQITVSQGVQPQVTQSPTSAQRPVTGPEAQLPEVEELSRIEAAFNLDPVRQFAVPMGLNQPASSQTPGALQAAVQQVSQQQQPSGQQQQPSGQQQQPGNPQQPSAQQQLQQPSQGQAMLGPFGAPL